MSAIDSVKYMFLSVPYQVFPDLKLKQVFVFLAFELKQVFVSIGF